ncbi:MAG: ferric reductase-like transmembrane domain-containing protein [Methyloligellaceae bacterium]
MLPKKFSLKSLVWVILVAAIGVPVALAATSPLLAWRGPVYITACFAGIIALALILLQPLLIGGYLSGLRAHLSRRAHRWIGAILVLAVIIHIGGLWITSPPDVIDALLFSSPTPFSNWGVIAMWALFATALLAIFRKRLNIGPQNWKFAHSILALVIVTGTVVHALLIEGTMETISKIILCTLVIAASITVIFPKKLRSNLRIWAKRILLR